MSTTSKVFKPRIENQICQGDVFKDVKYNYIDTEDEEGVDVIEYEFPLAIVISQACDVIAMEELVNNKRGKPAKFMPSVLLCPIYDKNLTKSGEHISDICETLSLSFEEEHIYFKEDYKIAQKDWHYRFHTLELSENGKIVLKDAIIDFKHYFSVPMTYLISHKPNRLWHLDDLFAEQLTLKFSVFLSRVAIP